LFTARYFGLLSRFYLGELRALAARVGDLVRESEERGDLYAATTLTARIGYAMRLADDDVDSARRDLATARERWSREGFHLQHVWCLFGEMETALYDGDPRLALSRWAEEEAAVKRSLLLRIQLLRIGAVQRRARAALATAATLPETTEERSTLLSS